MEIQNTNGLFRQRFLCCRFNIIHKKSKNGKKHYKLTQPSVTKSKKENRPKNIHESKDFANTNILNFKKTSIESIDTGSPLI